MQKGVIIMNWNEYLNKRMLIWQVLKDLPEDLLMEVTLVEIFALEQSELAPEKFVYLKLRKPPEQTIDGFSDFWIESNKIRLCGVLETKE